MTYVSEQNAQFAKESMACQSLDNDEILNVRWATEDPNPESKVTEKRRLEEMGREAIQARMDPRIVEAMRAVRALEDGDVLEDEADLQEQDEEMDGAPQAKRRRLEMESGEQVQEGEEDVEVPEPEAPKPTGLLSADTLESLKYFQEIRQRTGQAHALPSGVASKPPSSTGLGLADYGSDEED